MIDWLVYNGFAKNRGDLAARLGYNATVLSAAVNGRIPFSDKMSRRLCVFNKQLNLKWLLDEEGEMLKPEKDAVATTAAAKEEPTPSMADYAYRMVPFYYDLPITAGQVEQFGFEQANEMMYIPGVRACAFFTVRGFSMEPIISQGDLIGVRAVDMQERIDPENTYLIVTRNNERMIKHILPTTADSPELMLRSDNPQYPAFSILKSDIVGVWKVVYCGKNMG